MRRKMGVKSQITAGIFVIVTIITMVAAGSIVETVKKGTYVIKQAAITGKMTAYMKPGMFLQMFGDVQTWPKADTFYFIKDSKEGGSSDDSIEVRFNEGSLCNISGSIRIAMPKSPQQAIDLVTVEGYSSFADFETKLILKHVRNSLRLTANLMSARESYSEKRPDFVAWAEDQIQNGLYVTAEKSERVKDLISGEMVVKTFKVIKKDKDGNILREHNPLEGLGIRVSNFEIKDFDYSPKVKEQIKEQQEAYMAIVTAKANAQKAEQQKLTTIAEGKAEVQKAKYEKEQEKVRAVVDAEKAKEVAVIAASRQVAVAEQEKLEAEQKKLAAKEYKQEQILRGEGDAEYKRLVLQADGALAQKLKTYEEVMGRFAQEFGKQKWVPEVQMGTIAGSEDSGGNEAANLINLLTAKTLKDLGLDMSVPTGGQAQN